MQTIQVKYGDTLIDWPISEGIPVSVKGWMVVENPNTPYGWEAFQDASNTRCRHGIRYPHECDDCIREDFDAAPKRYCAYCDADRPAGRGGRCVTCERPFPTQPL